MIKVGSVRHYLNDNLKVYGGHIGYSVVPDERKNGYGTIILSLLLEEAKKLGINEVLVICDKNNIGSIKVIEKNNGIIRK